MAASFPRAEGVYQLVVKEPVGPVAAFTPWNFPINQVVRKLSARSPPAARSSQGAGGDTRLAGRTDPLLRRCRRARGRDQPGLRRAGGDFRVPDPAPDHPQDVVHRLHRRRQAACGDRRRAHEAGDDGTRRPRAGDRVRRCRCAMRQAGCWRQRSTATPARSACRRRALLVQERVYDQFVDGFVRHSKAVKVGDGLEAGTTMGPMANPRRITAMETFIGDATQHGAHGADRRPPHRQQGQLLRADGGRPRCRRTRG